MPHPKSTSFVPFLLHCITQTTKPLDYSWVHLVSLFSVFVMHLGATFTKLVFWFDYSCDQGTASLHYNNLLLAVFLGIYNHLHLDDDFHIV